MSLSLPSSFHLMGDLTHLYQAVSDTKMTIPQEGLQLEVIMKCIYKTLSTNFISLISCLSVRYQTPKVIRVSIYS